MRRVLVALSFLLLFTPNGAARADFLLTLRPTSYQLAKLTMGNWEEAKSLLQAFPKGLYRPCGSYLITYADPSDPYNPLYVGFGIVDKKIGGVHSIIMSDIKTTITLPLPSEKLPPVVGTYGDRSGHQIGYVIGLPPKEYAASTICLERRRKGQRDKNAI